MAIELVRAEGFTRREVARKFAALALALMLSTAAGGCGEELPRGFSRKTVDLGELPEPVMKAAKKAIPGVQFKDAWANLDAKKTLHSYEIRGRAANGKIREVRVSPAGEVLELE